LIISTLDHYLSTLNPDDGTVLWKSGRFEGAIASAPALVEDQTIIFGTFGGMVHAMDLPSHKILWSVKMGGWVWGSPVISGEQVIITDLKGNVTSLQIQDGSNHWAYETGSLITASPLVLDDQLAVPTEDGRLIFLDFSGGKLREEAIDGSLNNTPYLAGEMLLVTVRAKELLLVALSNQGGQVWTYFPEKK
jgi:outer membrane protein assembly factor BamB